MWFAVWTTILIQLVRALPHVRVYVSVRVCCVSSFDRFSRNTIVLEDRIEFTCIIVEPLQPLPTSLLSPLPPHSSFLSRAYSWPTFSFPLPFSSLYANVFLVFFFFCFLSFVRSLCAYHEEKHEFYHRTYKHNSTVQHVWYTIEIPRHIYIRISCLIYLFCLFVVSLFVFLGADSSYFTANNLLSMIGFGKI